MAKVVHYRKDKIIIDDEVLNKYLDLKKQVNSLIEEIEPIEKTLKAELMEVMRTLDKKKDNINGLVASFTESYVKFSIDTNRLKTEKPELYKEYLKETKISPSVSLKVE